MSVLHIYEKMAHAVFIARRYAKEKALSEYNYSDDKRVVSDVSDDWLYMDQACVKYTYGDGYDKLVYAVVELPEVEKNPDDYVECNTDDENEAKDETKEDE